MDRTTQYFEKKLSRSNSVCNSSSVSRFATSPTAIIQTPKTYRNKLGALFFLRNQKSQDSKK